MVCQGGWREARSQSVYSEAHYARLQPHWLRYQVLTARQP